MKIIHPFCLYKGACLIKEKKGIWGERERDVTGRKASFVQEGNQKYN